MNNIKTYNYKPKTLNAFLYFAGSIAFASFFYWMALTYEDAIAISFMRIIEFDFSHTTSIILFWIAAVFFTLTTYIYSLGLKKSLVSILKVTVTEESISLPKSFYFSNDHEEIAYSSISDLKPGGSEKERTVEIIYDNGSATLEEEMLPQKENFDEILDKILNKIENIDTDNESKAA